MNIHYQKPQSYSSIATGAGACFFQQPERAFVVFKDSAASARQRLVESGCPLTGLLILSALDNPALNSLDAVTSSLPASIRVLEIHNIECLLPQERRNAVEVLHLIDRIARFIFDHDMTGGATSAIDVGSAFTHGCAL
jgi:hypothetical protein